MAKDMWGKILWRRLVLFFSLLQSVRRVWRLLGGTRRIKEEIRRHTAGQLRGLLEKEDPHSRRELLEEVLQHNENLEKALQALRRRLQWCTLLAGLALLFALAALLVLLFGAEQG